MNIALLSGAYGNSGDSLIEQRCKALLENIYGAGSVDIFSRKALVDNFDEINSHDLVVFSGGPIYQQDIGKNFNVSQVIKLTSPIKICGGGVWGYCRSYTLPYKYSFVKDTHDLFSKINTENGLSCRDLYSLKTLQHAGWKNAVMTGCPAWYDLNLVHHTKVRIPETDSDGKKSFAYLIQQSNQTMVIFFLLLRHYQKSILMQKLNMFFIVENKLKI